MSSLDASRAVPALKSFSLTHILYDPTDRLSIPLTLLSLSPIFLFVSYFTLIIFNRRLTILLLALGSIFNEALSLALKRVWKGDRPYQGLLGDVGDSYGMPSSHSQAAGFLVGWGIVYYLAHGSNPAMEGKSESRQSMIARYRQAIYMVGLVTWSVTVAYSRSVIIWERASKCSRLLQTDSETIDGI